MKDNNNEPDILEKENLTDSKEQSKNLDENIETIRTESNDDIKDNNKDVSDEFVSKPSEKKNGKRIFAILIVLLFLTPIPFLIYNCTKPNNNDTVPASTSTPSSSQQSHLDEAATDPSQEVSGGEPCRIFNNTRVYKCSALDTDKYTENESIAPSIVSYIWQNLDEYIDYDCQKFVEMGYVQNRGPLFSIITYDDFKHKMFIEIGYPENSSSIYYAKISNNFNSDQTYYLVTLKENSTDNYNLKCEKTNYADIKNKITQFTDKPNEYADDMAYAQYTYDSLHKSGVYIIEGDSDKFTVDEIYHRWILDDDKYSNTQKQETTNDSTNSVQK